jgi:hypothetical protein
MKRLITYLTVAALAALPLTSSAQINRSAAVALVANYNLAATSYTYSFFRGPDDGNADPLGSGVKWPSKVKTTAGAQATIEAFTASSAPFAALVAGDLLMFPNAPTVPNTGASGFVNVQGRTQRQERVIVTATDANNVDVDTAIDLSQDATGYNFYWKKFVTGVETTDGWFSVGNFDGVEFDIQVTTIAATSIDYSIECRHAGVNAAAKQLDVGSISSATLGSNSHTFYLGLPYDQCRVGLKVTGDAGTQAVWVSIVGEKYDSR